MLSVEGDVFQRYVLLNIKVSGEKCRKLQDSLYNSSILPVWENMSPDMEIDALQIAINDTEDEFNKSATGPEKEKVYNEFVKV